MEKISRAGNPTDDNATHAPYMLDNVGYRHTLRMFIQSNTSVNNTTILFIYNGIYVRVTCFDMVGHPQARQEYRSKRCLGFLHCGIPNAYKFQYQTIYKLVQIELVV